MGPKFTTCKFGCKSITLQRKIKIYYMFNPKNIIFDLGGVILNINYQATLNALKNLGWTNVNELYSQASQAPETSFFEDYEKGMLSCEDFLATLATYVDHKIEQKELRNAWNAMLLDIPMERLNLLLKIKENYNLFLLSNTNQLHLNYLKENLPNEQKNLLFDSIFQKLYFSNEIHLKKPDKEIFEFVLQDQNIRAEETLFIDDSLQHIQTAKTMGIRTFFMQETSMDEIFSPNGSLCDISIYKQFN